VSIITTFQFSPPAHLNKVQKLSEKEVKLITEVTPWPHFTNGYKFIPKRENINKDKQRRAPILINSGRVSIKVMNIIRIDFAPFTNLKILIILKVLKMLIDVPSELIKFS
jgi:hypothetical protein